MPYVPSLPQGVSRTGNDIIEEVIRLLLSGYREDLNKLKGDVGANAQSLSFYHPLGGIRAGAQIEVDLEVYRVWEASGSSDTATVEPAMSGTVSAEHTDGTLVRVNPRLQRAAVFSALNDEIRSLSSPLVGLYRMGVLEFTYRGDQYSYDLPGAGEALDIYEVSALEQGSLRDWYRLTDWRLERNADPTQFPSGLSLFMPTGHIGRPVRVLYKAPFTPLSDPLDDLDAAGRVPQEMQDILALGVLLRLGPVREIKRNFTEAQGDSRRAEEVGAGAVMNSFRYVQQQHDARIAAELARLQQRYPIVRK